MSLLGLITRGFKRIANNFEFTAVKCTSLANHVFSIDLAPYQILFVNPDKINYFHPDISLEYTAGKILELNYASNEGSGFVALSGADDLKVFYAEEPFCFVKSAFVFATSEVKIVENEEFLEGHGKGKVVVNASEVIELEDDEKIVVSQKALVGCDVNVQRKLVNNLDFVFWKLKGPGKVAIKWVEGEHHDKNIEKCKNEPILDKKEDSDTEENKSKPLLTKILDNSDIII